MMGIESLLPLLPIYLLGGLCAGFLSGLLGIGGGVIYVPVILYILFLSGYEGDLTMHIAVGTSLATVMFNALTATYAHSRRGDGIDTSIVKKWLIFLMMGSISGGIIIRFLSGDMMKMIFGVMLFYLGLRLIFKKQHKPNFILPTHNIYFRALFGWCIGVVASLIGIGGSIFMTPTLMASKITIHKAIAVAPIINIAISSAASVAFIVQGIGVVGRPPFSLGYIHLPTLLLFIPAILISVPKGANLAHRLNPQLLKKIFGAFLTIVSIKVGLSAFDIGVLDFIPLFF